MAVRWRRLSFRWLPSTTTISCSVCRPLTMHHPSHTNTNHNHARSSRLVTVSPPYQLTSSQCVTLVMCATTFCYPPTELQATHYFYLIPPSHHRCIRCHALVVSHAHQTLAPSFVLSFCCDRVTCFAPTDVAFCCFLFLGFYNFNLFFREGGCSRISSYAPPRDSMRII